MSNCIGLTAMNTIILYHVRRREVDMKEIIAAVLLPIPVTQQRNSAPCPTVAATILSQRASLKTANLLIVNRATTHSRRRAGMEGEKSRRHLFVAARSYTISFLFVVPGRIILIVNSLQLYNTNINQRHQKGSRNVPI